MVVFLMSCFYRIFWESKQFEGHTDKVEPWYGTAYSVEKITSSLIQVCRPSLDLNKVAWFIARSVESRFRYIHCHESKNLTVL